jgi:chromosome segregation ATPase
VDALQVVTIIGLVAAPLAGVVVALIVDRRTKMRNSMEGTVAERSVKVEEREAYNHEVAIIIEGFTASLERTDKELARALARIEQSETSHRITREELKDTQIEVKELRLKHEQNDRQRAEMIRHIQALEALVPTPPGPPTRPYWLS